MEPKSSGIKPFRIPDDPDLDEAVWSANHGDENHLCRKCGEYSLAIFYLGDGQVVLGCPECLLISLGAIRSRRKVLPPVITRLEYEALDALDLQNRKKLRDLQVIREEIFKCHVCGKELVRSETRFFFKPGEIESPIYCATCQEEIRLKYPSQETADVLRSVILHKKTGIARLEET